MVPAPTLVLRDRNAALVAAWQRRFAGCDAIEIGQGDIFEVQADAIVSPANSFGYMDGGIDAVYLERFGAGLQARLQRVLFEEHHGELPVGEAVMVETHDASLPWLVSAPTMRIPGPVPKTHNAYLAFRAALRTVMRHNEHAAAKVERVLCPGLATAIGAMPEDRCARQMRLARDVVLGARRWPPLSVREIWETHDELLR